MSNRVVCLLLSITLTSCIALHGRNDTALAIAQSGNLTQQVLDTGKFRLTMYYRGLEDRNSELAVYIEGDGYAWKQKYLLSDDPTPVDPVALKLAAKDPSPALLYIARPCQYLTLEELKDCDPKYWSSHRYAEEVIRSVNGAIDWGVRKTGADGVNLYGYSGGGAVAALVAARRPDVIRLVTVAANLDHVLWTRIQGISPLSGSLNPADATDKLENIPQLHYAGGKDDIVPVSILESYRAGFGKNANVILQVIPEFDHHCCWADDWPHLLSQATRETGPKQRIPEHRALVPGN